MLNPRLLILPLSLLLFGFTDPHHFKDDESGLAVDPPNSYVALPLPPNEQSTAALLVGIFRYDADLAQPTPPFCVLSLHVRADNAERTQQELNARMRDPGRIANILETFNGSQTVIADEPIELGGVFGHQVTMEARDAADGHDDLMQVNSFFDAPAGRVTLNCASTRTDLVSNLVSFGLIRESITLP